MADIQVTIETPGMTLDECVIPDHYLPEHVVSDVIDEVKLQRMLENGEVITYSLLHVNHNLTLAEDKTLVESGVRTGDTVRVVPSHSGVKVQVNPEDVSFIKEPLKGEIEVVLSVLDLNKAEKVILPDDLPVGEVIRRIAADYGLPAYDKLNAVITYRLASKALGRMLDNAKTLAAEGVPPLDRLTVHRKEEAGARQ